MGKPWASPAEQDFLDAELQNYVSVKEQGKYGDRSKFFNSVYHRYFEKFPMPETDESGQSLEERMSDRRDQIARTLDWGVRRIIKGDPRSRKTSTPRVGELTKILRGRGRCAHEIEVYQKEHGEKLNPKVTVEISKAGATSNQEKMAIRRRVTKDEYEKEPEAVKTAVRKEYEKQKEKAREARKHHDSQPRTSEDTVLALNKMPGILSTVVQQLAKETGWTYFIAAAGPNPAAGGKIFMRKFFYGEHESGQSFEEAYTDFNKGFQIPFIEYANACFSSGVHQARTINTPGTPGSQTSSIDDFEGAPPRLRTKGDSDDDESYRVQGNEASYGDESDRVLDRSDRSDSGSDLTDNPSNADSTSTGNADGTSNTSGTRNADNISSTDNVVDTNHAVNGGHNDDDPGVIGSSELHPQVVSPPSIAFDKLPDPPVAEMATGPSSDSSDLVEMACPPQNNSQLDYTLPGAFVSSPLASVKTLSSRVRAGRSADPAAAKTSSKRKAVEPEAPVVTGKRIKKPTRDPEGNEYNAAGTSGRGQGVRGRARGRGARGGSRVRKHA